MIALYLICFVLFLCIFFTVFIIPQQTVVIIERFGKFQRVATAGLNFKIPLIDSIAGAVNLRVQQLDVMIETKTQDNVFVHIMVSVQYCIAEDKVYEAFYKLVSPTKQIQAFVFDVVRAKVPTIILDDVFSKKDDIAVALRKELSGILQTFGYTLLQALVTDIQPNENVKNAMNEINTAQRMRMAAHEKAEAEKIVRVKQAEGEAEANILHGKGIAGQRQAIIDGFKQSMAELHDSAPYIKPEELMHMILMIQYFDVLREIGGDAKTNTLFLNHAPSSISDALKQLNDTMLAKLQEPPF